MLILLTLLLCATLASLLWRDAGPAWLSGLPEDALLLAAAALALLIAWKLWRRLRGMIRDIND